ncbi:NADH-dependent flavin oxidoreductase [Paenalkalicoccus suaedae]|uniref:NADH-dependent flavin oxidoreductase n=1 Tax=Paenalkalicoccus suaedae TaxID=2592382 RepID=A0A859FAY7_9BACI|nr:NADH-dependent flavin oxidoreductase [Paenalkalicoccus suaedae]QKS69811.1 NADH-dependent flavin oxidoreductase [Paenalkalicoccus suaedae]
MRKFLEPFTLKNGATLKNRIMLAPMTNFSSDEKGNSTPEEIEYYRVRSQGVGTVITAVANVIEGGKGFPGEIGIFNDEQIPSLKKLADTIKAEGAKAIIQIFHAGRMAPPNLLPDNQPTSASAVAPEREGAVTPRELTGEEVDEIVQAFGDATRRAIEAGFDGVEIHGANTYLIQQFFSPHSNRRTDKWGGDVNERMSFPLAVIDSVNEAAKHADEEFIVGYRLSPEERENPGITMEDTLQFVNTLKKQDLDYLHISVQDFFAGSMRDESDTRSRVQLIQDEVGSEIPVVGVGSLHTPDDVEKAMEGGTPLIALGRELIVEPEWIQKVEQNRESEIRVDLSVDDRETLVVPQPLWDAIINTPGWFPVREHANK